jgi:hypothetical protein
VSPYEIAASGPLGEEGHGFIVTEHAYGYGLAKGRGGLKVTSDDNLRVSASGQ